MFNFEPVDLSMQEVKVEEGRDRCNELASFVEYRGDKIGKDTKKRSTQKKKHIVIQEYCCNEYDRTGE